MVDRNNAGKLLSFPVPRPVPGSPAENWCLRILETKDNLVSALELLRIAYNEMLAGKPVKAADEILAQVEAILRKDERILRIQLLRPSRFLERSRQTQNERSCCSFPQFEAMFSR
jgi:hypothetical protein